jgi:serine/threonine-protein kinase
MAWLIVAFLTTLVGLAAVNSLGDGILGSAERPLTHESVEAQLSSSAPAPASSPSDSPSDSPSVSPSPPVTPSAEPVSRTFSSGGGTVTAGCDGDLVTLKYWSPAQGYEADHVVPGPGPTASIRFRQGGRGHGIRLAFGCDNGEPVQSASEN